MICSCITIHSYHELLETTASLRHLLPQRLSPDSASITVNEYNSVRIIFVTMHGTNADSESFHLVLVAFLQPVTRCHALTADLLSFSALLCIFLQTDLFDISREQT